MSARPPRQSVSDVVRVSSSPTTALTIHGGYTAISVHVDADGAAGIDGALVRVFGYAAGVRAQIGADAPVTSRTGHRVLSRRGVGTERWDVEIVGVGAPVDGVRVAAVAYGREP